MRFPRLLVSLGIGMFSASAWAGGVGLIGTAGFHEGRAYYYRDDGLQGIDVQTRPNTGFGFEGLLGDRDDRMMGLLRMYSLTDSALQDPDLTNEDTQNHTFIFPPAADQGSRTVGVMMVGVQWNILGDPTGGQLMATTLAGSGFATEDSLEFLIIEPGVGYAHTFSERYQIFATAAYTVRYRKRIYLGENVYAGVRYLFD